MRMFLALKKSSRDFCSSLFTLAIYSQKKDRSEYLPVDVAELVFAQTTLQTDSDVKCAAGGDSASDTRHRNNRDVLHLNVSRGLGDEHKALIQEVQETLVGLDGTLDAMVTMVAVDGLVLGVINVATGLY